MCRHCVADKGDGLQVRRAARICSTSGRGQPTTGGPRVWQFGAGLTDSYRKKIEILHGISDIAE
jgi:hypothetical protein